MNRVAIHKTKIIIAVVALISLGLFQNCGKSYEYTPTTVAELGAKSINESNQNIDAVVGESVNLEVPEMGYLEFLNEGDCRWTYIGSDNQPKDIQVSDRIVKLGKVSKRQAGTYQLNCSNSKKQSTFRFEVAITDPVAPPDAVGLYKGNFIVAGKPVSFASVDNTTYLTAIESCKKTAAANMAAPLKGITCLWQNTVIYSRDEQFLINTLVINTISNKVTTKDSEVKNLNEVDARAKCKDFIAKYKTVGVQCLWGTMTVGSQAEPIVTVPIVKNSLLIYITTSYQEYMVINTGMLSEAEARSQCTQYIAQNTQVGVRCTWGNLTLALKADPKKLAILQTFYTRYVGYSEQTYAIPMSKTLQQAKDYCEAQAAIGRSAIYQRGFRCLWDGVEIYKIAVVGTYYFGGSGR